MNHDKHPNPDLTTSFVDQKRKVLIVFFSSENS